MDISTLATVITALGGFELIKWAVNRISYRKQQKRIKNSEAVKSMADAGSSIVATEKALRDMYEETLSEMRKEYVARIGELRVANAELNKQATEHVKEMSRKEDIIADKTARIRELQDKRVDDARHIGLLEKQLAHYKNWFCKRESGNGKGDCRRREPAQNPPLKYTPTDEDRATSE